MYQDKHANQRSQWIIILPNINQYVFPIIFIGYTHYKCFYLQGISEANDNIKFYNVDIKDKHVILLAGHSR